MGTKIVTLPSTTVVQSDAYIPISQDITGNNRTTYKITAQQLASFIGQTTSSGTVNSVGLNSDDYSVFIENSPITTKGTINVKINRVDLNKIANGGATNGQVLTYDSIAHQWKPIDSSNTGVTADSVQIGTVLWFAASSVPLGYLECNGSSKKIADYSDLFNVIGTTYGALINSGTEFILPDLRGEFIRGWDHGRGVDKNDGVNPRGFGNSQTESLSAHSHKYQKSSRSVSANESAGATFAYGTDEDTSITGGTETRPRNVALLPCIKALKTVQGTTSILNFIEKPSNPTNGQVLTYNTTTNSWSATTIKTASDIIIQTGVLTFSTNLIQNKTFIYPTPFTTNILSVNVTPTGTAAMSVSNITLTSCDVTNGWAGGWLPNALSAYITVFGI